MMEHWAQRDDVSTREEAAQPSNIPRLQKPMLVEWTCTNPLENSTVFPGSKEAATTIMPQASLIPRLARPTDSHEVRVLKPWYVS